MAERTIKIGIVGAGQIGGTLTRRLTAVGHEVLLANARGPDTFAELAAERPTRRPRAFRCAALGLQARAARLF